MAVVTYTPAQLQLSVGETVTVSWASDTSLWLVLPTSADENVATATPIENHTTYGTFTVTGVGDGTTTITIDGYNFLGVTVGTVEDESYLNKRGLTHFWENIDDIKQDKLTAGTNISINNNTISSSQPAATTSSLGVVQVGSGLTISSGGVLSATGGGVADSVAWGHVTGTLADQTDLQDALDAKADSSSLATVATSGSYNDLSNKPTIPTVNNATLTIQKNGTTVNTFTANASSNVTANITVPTATSDLTNDSGFVDTAAIAGKQDLLTAGDHINITNNTIKAVDYVHSEQPVATQAVTPVVTGNMISNGTITADKLASGATVQLTLSTSDIGEGSPLAANTLYGVYI